MNKSEIVEILNYPDAALVRYAAERANLSEEEWTVISAREIQNETVERLAERLNISDTTVKRRYRAGMEKLTRCWSGLEWLRALRIYSKSLRKK